MMEGEGGIGLSGTHDLAGVLGDDMEDDASLRLPAIVPNKRLARHPEIDRIHDERELGQDQMVLAHAEAVHVGRPPGGDLCDLSLRAVIADAANAIEAVHAESRHVVIVARALRVVMRVRGRDLAGKRLAIGEDAECLEGRRRKANWHQRLGEGDRLARVVRDIDVAIVGRLRREHRSHAAEQCAARVGREFAVGDLAGFFRGGERLALEEAVGVGDAAIRNCEAVQHRKSVEPMI
jgi:hypothetical protein